MRKKGTIVINGVVFELNHEDSCDSVNFVSGAAYDEINNVYYRPSYAKVSVWHSWCDWCFHNIENGIPCTLEIAGHNCNMFSISGKINYEGHVYRLWITRDHNRAFLIA